jgi:branched-chain amino acid transport system permease protein
VSSYIQQLIIDSSLLIILATGLGVTYGNCGILSLCHATLYGAGAYTAALLFTLLSTDSWIVNLLLICTLGLSGGLVVSWCIGNLCLRLKGDYVALATIAFGELARALVLNTDALGGARGIRGIPEITNMFAAIAVAALAVLSARFFLQSPWGRMIEAVRDNSPWATSLAIPVQKARLAAFVFGGGLAGIAGALFAFKQQYIHPNSFNIMASITILLAVILGGKGNLTGYIVGAIFIAGVSEALRFIPGSEDWQAMGMGATLLITSWFFTKGIFGNWPYFDPIRRGFYCLNLNKDAASEAIPKKGQIRILEVRNLEVTTGQTTIIKSISLTFKAGNPIAIIGPNGSGKSTLAMALAGDIPSLGRISIDKDVLHAYHRGVTVKRNIIHLPQHPHGCQRLSALDNVRLAIDRDFQHHPIISWLPFVARNQTIRSARAAMGALDQVGLKDEADHIFATLSYGQKKRTLLAAALLADPLVLILDEPFAGLNTGPGSESETITHAMQTRIYAPNRITVIIDHRIELIKAICKEFILLDAGRIEASGKIEELMQTKEFREIYERASA